MVLASDGTVKLVDMAPELTHLGSQQGPVLARHAFAVNAAGSHLKGLIDGKVVVHGHAAARPTGKVALRFIGEGVVGVERVEVVRLDGQ